MRPVTVLLLLATILAPPTLLAQTTSSANGNSRRVQVNANVAVRLIDGSVIYGVLERQDADSVVVVGSSGRLAFAAARVRQLRPAGVAHTRADGSTEYWFPNANTTRLFFAPTGRMLARGEGYFADHWVVLGSVAVGVTDRVTMGGGSFLVPNPGFWFVTPKVGIVRSENVNVAAGVLLGGADGETGGIGFVSSTFGGEDNNVTIAIGNAFAGDKLANSQVYMLGGETRISRRLTLVTENYLIPGLTKPLISYGVRILGEKMSVDLAFINYTGNMVFPGIPYLDFVVRFSWLTLDGAPRGCYRNRA